VWGCDAGGKDKGKTMSRISIELIVSEMEENAMFKHVTIRIIGVMSVILLALTAVGADKASRPDALAEGFRTPPDSAKSSCYWWWLDSNATKEGITRDLEEMKRQGITQAVIYDGGKGTFSGEDENYKPRIRGVLDYDPVKGDGSPIGPLFMGPEWREMFKHAVKEANRLGIEIGQPLQRLGLRRKLGDSRACAAAVGVEQDPGRGADVIFARLAAAPDHRRLL
jgi:hypothetical protein